MTETLLDPLMVDMIQGYLLAQESKKMGYYLNAPDVDLDILAKVQGRLDETVLLKGG